MGMSRPEDDGLKGQEVQGFRIGVCPWVEAVMLASSKTFCLWIRVSWLEGVLVSDTGLWSFDHGEFKLTY